jgi:hypothetical protein
MPMAEPMNGPIKRVPATKNLLTCCNQSGNETFPLSQTGNKPISQTRTLMMTKPTKVPIAPATM